MSVTLTEAAKTLLQNPPGGRRILDLGCGHNKREGTLGMDIRDDSQADVIHDFNAFPYPFEDDTFDEVLSVSALTYADDIFRAMLEIRRITKPGGTVRVFGPSFNSTAYSEDPYIKNRLSHNTFLPLCSPIARTWAHYRSGGKAWFRPKRIEYRMSWDSKPGSFFQRAILWLANRNQDFYLARLAYILPVQRIYYELEVLK